MTPRRPGPGGVAAPLLFRPVRSERAAAWLAVVLVCVPSTIGAIGALPVWDDAYIWLTIAEHGVGGIGLTQPDRPFMAALWGWLAPSEQAFWTVAVLAQALLWPALGILAALLWNRLFPGCRAWAPVVACVAVAPYLSKVVVVTANIALASLLSVVPAYAAGLLILRWVDVGARGRPGLLVSLPLLAFATLLQEYALPIVAVIWVVLASRLRATPDAAVARRALVGMVGSGLLTAAAYVAYLLAGDLAVRPDVLPTVPLSLGISAYLKLPFRLATATWQGLIGHLAGMLGAIQWTSLTSLVATAYGILVAATLMSLRRRWADTPPEPPALHPGWLMAALAVSLLPVLVMGRIPWNPGDGTSSRFGLPALPIVAALVVLGVRRLVHPRFWAVPVALLGFAAGYVAVTDAWLAVSERALTASLGAALRPHVEAEDGYVVAVVALPERPLGPRRQWELTARLTATWPPELRRRLWAYRFAGGPPLHYREEARRVFGERTACTAPTRLHAGIRVVTRQGPLARLLWVAPRADGSVAIEDYCVHPVGGTAAGRPGDG